MLEDLQGHTAKGYIFRNGGICGHFCYLPQHLTPKNMMNLLHTPTPLQNSSETDITLPQTCTACQQMTLPTPHREKSPPDKNLNLPFFTLTTYLWRSPLCLPHVTQHQALHLSSVSLAAISQDLQPPVILSSFRIFNFFFDFSHQGSSLDLK